MNRKFIKSVSLISILLVFSLVLSGCVNFRKKFIRQKKASQKDEFIPVLDPIDYGTSAVSARERYTHYYSLWKVWHKEIDQAIEREVSDKKQKYIVGQMGIQLEEMSKWVEGEKQQQLMKTSVQFTKVLKYFDKPPVMRNKVAFKSKLNKFARIVRDELSPDDVEDALRGN